LLIKLPPLTAVKPCKTAIENKIAVEGGAKFATAMKPKIASRRRFNCPDYARQYSFLSNFFCRRFSADESLAKHLPSA
jgi:hypothetical protein